MSKKLIYLFDPSLLSVVNCVKQRIAQGICLHREGRSRMNSRRKLGMELLQERALFAVLIGEDSVFDLDRFEQNIRNYFVDNSVGFAYSINMNGVSVRQDGWGDARREDDGQVDFTENTKMTSASIAKTITATGLLKILQDTPGVGIDSPISPYLPSAWVQGPNINTITFRELLTHHSGLRRQDWNGNGTDDDTDGDTHESASLQEQTYYSGLQQLIVTGIPVTRTAAEETPNQVPYTVFDLKDDYSYENANFALIRVMTPYLLGDGEAADNAEDPAQYSADAYVEYIRTNVLAPMGIVNANTAPDDESPTLNYEFPLPGAGINYDDRTLYAGGEGWWLSADDLAKFLHGLRTNDDVLAPATRQLMRDGFLGWNDPNHGWKFAEGMFGTYYNHGGDLNNLHTGIVDFPNGVQVALLINSEFTNAPYQLEALKRSFENAWPELTLIGSDAVDAFEVRRNPLDNSSMDIFHNGDYIGTRWGESLERLTLSGLGGQDTFYVDGLSAQTDIRLLGGLSNDSFTIVDSDIGVVEIDVTAEGGGGNDSLVFNEGWVFGGATYIVTNDTIAKSSREGQIHFSGLEDVTVHGGNTDDAMYVYSTGGAQIRIHGHDGNDTIEGGPAADVLMGGPGNDTIQGNAGNDTIYGDEGNDFIGGWLGNDLIFGGPDNDIISGDDGTDIVVGEDGNDLLAGGRDNDTVTGSDGNDILVGGVFSLNAILIPESGDDLLDGGNGADTLYGDSWAFLAPLTFSILGGNDTMQGGADNDIIYGQAGNDFIGGSSGADLILGGRGDDIANGDDGNDIVVGEDGNDLLAGGHGNDNIIGGNGNDILVGGLFSAGNTVPDEADGDSIDGGDGADTIYGDSLALGDPFNPGIQGGDDTIQGGRGNDILVGQAGNDFIGGWLGNDLILGGQGDDVLSGDQGQDTVDGGAGNDLVAGGQGDDSVSGGEGNDVLVGGVYSAGASVDAELGNDSLNGGNGEDILFGDSWALGAPFALGVLGGNDTLRGGSGNDLLIGQSGSDLIFGDEGNDNLQGNSGDDIIRGGSGNDQLGGGTGNDLLLGETGQDTINGNAGRDVLIGGLDADVLDGGSDDDILIAGTTLHDDNNVALNEILAEWTSARNYTQRIKNLKGIGNGPAFNNRLNGSTFLRKNGNNNNITVFDDNSSDTLAGAAGQDWFLFDPALDDLLDRVGGEDKN